MSSNSQTFIKQVKADLLAQFKKNAVGISNKIYSISQDVIDDFAIPNTGFLSLRTFTKFQVNLGSDVVAETSFQTRGVDYAKYVTKGSGTNSDYGERNYLVEARTQVADYLTTGNYTRIYKKGSPNKGSRVYQRRKF
jgi:hypothetical protein